MPSFTDYREFLYNEDGRLLFYYSKLTGYSCGEKRLYFDNGELIKIKFNSISGGNCVEESNFPNFTRYAGKLSKEDLSWEKWIIEKAKNHREAVVNLYDSTQ